MMHTTAPWCGLFTPDRSHRHQYMTDANKPLNHAASNTIERVEQSLSEEVSG